MKTHMLRAAHTGPFPKDDGLLVSLVCSRTVVLLGLLSVGMLFAPSRVDGQISGRSQLQDVSGGKAWVAPQGNLRIRFIGVKDTGYNVSFDVRDGGYWRSVAAFPKGKVWAVYSKWGYQSNLQPKWYWGEHGFNVSQIGTPADGSLRVLGQGVVDGQSWDFEDRYSFENGAVRVLRRWHHAGPKNQSPITLVTALRVAVGSNPRVLFPGILYNDNPAAYPTRQVPHLAQVAGARGAYEEHRFPVPFVNLESTVSNRRQFASLLSIPSKVSQGHKGDDQWWSLGLDWHWGGEVDLLNISGAVATNEMDSMVYGHLNGFDPYEDAYIDVKGDVTFEKTLYIDCGIAPRVGYAFRETLWKAFQIFQPVKTPSMSFPQAMDLKFKYATETYHEEPNGSAGFSWIQSDDPIWDQHYDYGCWGHDLGIAYSFLAEADRTGDETYRRMGLNTIRFFVDHVRRETPGLLYVNYSYAEKKWVSSYHLPEWPDSISSRELGDALNEFADVIAWAKNHRMAEADHWLALLVESGNFLAGTRRYRGLFPRAWYGNGRPVGWEGNIPATGTITASGVYLVPPLAKLYQFTGDKRYLEVAETALRAYYEEYGRDLHQSYSGATLDAASEDKEAGGGFLLGAVALYEATHNREYLQWAQDAADWVLTWYYMYDVQIPSGSPLHDVMNTVGWTAISVQNQEIDMWGNFVAPALYALGKYLKDRRYQQIAQTIFAASTQTIARPGVTLGLKSFGMQYEHYNQTNCTYMFGGAWRGTSWTPSIGWVLAATLYNGTKMVEVGAFKW